jgi:hypothetical protein
MGRHPNIRAEPSLTCLGGNPLELGLGRKFLTSQGRGREHLRVVRLAAWHHLHPVDLVLGRLLEALPNTQLISAYPQASIGSTRHSHADPQADQHDRSGG